MDFDFVKGSTYGVDVSLDRCVNGRWSEYFEGTFLESFTAKTGDVYHIFLTGGCDQQYAVHVPKIERVVGPF